MIARIFFFYIMLAAATKRSRQDGKNPKMPDQVSMQAQNEFAKSLIPKDVLKNVGTYSLLLSSSTTDHALLWNALIEYYLKVTYTVNQINGNNNDIKKKILEDWYKKSFISIEDCLGDYLPCYRRPGVQYQWNSIAKALITLSSADDRSDKVRIKTGLLRLSKPSSNLLKHAEKVFDELNGTYKPKQKKRSSASTKNQTELIAEQKSEKMTTQVSLLMSVMRLIDRMTLKDYEALDASQQELFKKLIVFAYQVYGDNHIKELDINDLVFEPKRAFAGINSTKMEKMFAYLRSYQVDELFEGLPKYNAKDVLVKLNKTPDRSASSGSESKNANINDGKVKNCADKDKANKSGNSGFGSMWKWGLIIAAALLILATASYLIYYLVKSKE